MASAPRAAAVAANGSGAAPARAAVQLDARAAILAVAESCVGWTERTGRNDGPEVDRVLGAVGLAGTGSPYCAAFVYYCGWKAGYPVYPRSAWSPDMVARPTWTRARGGPEPRPADAFGIYFAAKGRVAHTGLIKAVKGNIFETIEGNTAPEAKSGTAADRDGDGFWKKRRLRTQIYATRDWVESPTVR